jgi:corrinoid protein of di/trimethylamine methyltransferase
MSPHDPMTDLRAAIEGGDEEATARIVADLLAGGASPAQVMASLSDIMRRLGERFHRLEVFVPDLLIAADAFQAAMNVIEPALAKGPHTSRGTIVLGVVAGDIHSLGKDLVRVMLVAEGFTVHDLGRDVSTDHFLSAAETVAADMIAMSALMTTTMGRMKEVVDLLSARGVRDRYRVLIGGAPVTQQFADAIGADGYAEDASEAVRVASQLLATRQEGHA